MKKWLAVMAAVLLLPLAIASAAGPPEQKEGLWSIHRQSINNSGSQTTDSSSTICRSHTYDAYTLSLVKTKKGLHYPQRGLAGQHLFRRVALHRGRYGCGQQGNGYLHRRYIGALRDQCHVYSSARRRQ